MYSKLLLLSTVMTMTMSYVIKHHDHIHDQGDSYIPPDGIYEWTHQSEDGTFQQHSGELQQLGHDKGQTSKGSVTWVDPEGGQHQVSYRADDKGFVAESADLPTPPPIPAAILKSIVWTAQKRNRPVRIYY